MKRYENEGIGHFVQRVMMTSTLKNKEILDLVEKEYPNAKTTIACIAWYRSDLKKNPKVTAVVKEPSLEDFDNEIKKLELQLEEAKKKREEFVTKNKEEMKKKYLELQAQLKALEEVVEEEEEEEEEE